MASFLLTQRHNVAVCAFTMDARQTLEPHPATNLLSATLVPNSRIMPPLADLGFCWPNLTSENLTKFDQTWAKLWPLCAANIDQAWSNCQISATLRQIRPARGPRPSWGYYPSIPANFASTLRLLDAGYFVSILCRKCAARNVFLCRNCVE